MNLVRLFTLSAASIGLAIAAGTMFQPEPDDGAASAQAMVDQPAPEAMVVAAGARTPLTGSLASLSGPREAADMDRVAEQDAPLPRPLPGDGKDDLPILANLTEIEPDSETSLSDSEMAELLAEASACAVWVVVTAEPAAMLDLSLYAPCDAGGAVIISHGPMRLSATVGLEGLVAMSLPALSPQAEVSVSFADGRIESDMTDVPDFGMFPRVIVQWDGPAALDLHAYAGGARWGEAGHVQAGGAISAAAGFVSVLSSDDEAQVRIYTFPAGIQPESGLILLEAEVAITADSCGRPLDAQIHLVRDDLPVARHNLRVDMPACDTLGGFVLLPDMIPHTGTEMSAMN